MKSNIRVIVAVAVIFCFSAPSVFGESSQGKSKLFDLGKLKPVDSELKVKSGELAPDFSLPSISGKKIRLSQYRGKNNVVISFVPAAWTPVCSEQWPGYNLAKEQFKDTDTILLGITVDNVPSLKAWIGHIGLVWFDVLSDFWPHGEVAGKYGVLRTDGLCERALFLSIRKGSSVPVWSWISIRNRI
jgi:peroxiredoxin